MKNVPILEFSRRLVIGILTLLRNLVIYGFVASMIGTVLGIVAGHYLLSRIIAQIVTSDTTLGETHLYFYWNYTAIALVLALISAVLPAFLIAKNELSEKPAQLLLPKPPIKGSKIFLERIGVIWRRLSFSIKLLRAISSVTSNEC